MSRAFALLLGLLLAGTASALPRWVDASGQAGSLFAGPDGTYTFPAQALAHGRWLELPRGWTKGRLELWAGATRRSVIVPENRLVDSPTLVAVPDTLRAVAWRGANGDDPTLRFWSYPPASGALLVTSDLSLRLAAWNPPAHYVAFVALDLVPGSPSTIRVTDGTHEREFRLSGTEKRWTFPAQAWGFEPLRVEVSRAAVVGSVSVRAVDAATDIPADPEAILAWPRADWRRSDREWFRWLGTEVTVLVTDSYDRQDAYLKRLAFFVEKTGTRGQILSDEQMSGQHGWNAHDYAAPDLAAFFTKALAEGAALTPQELELRDRLVTNGVLVAQGTKTWVAGTGALVAFSAESPPALRRALFVHEGFHGLYFTSPDFQRGTATAWAALSEGARNAFRRFLALSNYDPNFEALMVNEFQAYVLQRPAAEWPAFFRDRVLSRQKALASRYLGEYLEAARSLQTVVGGLFGLKAGTIAPFTVSAPGT